MSLTQRGQCPEEDSSVSQAKGYTTYNFYYQIAGSPGRVSAVKNDGHVVICSVGLIIYPVGLESNVIKMYCGQSAASFNPGNCEIGWGYVLAIMGTALTMFGPFLSKYAIDKPRLEDSEEFV
ncbi:hypothetical protein Bbelb_145990 [Branchiostoma belcheri]|nr:hypothetical protein Bbelb_145990 [Branchiostoma belcheri]